MALAATQAAGTEEQCVLKHVLTSWVWVPAPLVVWGWGEERGCLPREVETEAGLACSLPQLPPFLSIGIRPPLLVSPVSCPS